jgi:hypothetical protein
MVAEAEASFQALGARPPVKFLEAVPISHRDTYSPMDVPVKQLVCEFVNAVTVPAANEEEDVFLQGLVDDFQSSSALFKRDMRRRLEKDPPGFLRAACRILKASNKGLKLT